MKNPYRVLGLILAISGAVLAPFAYFLISSVAITAVAISAVMIGLTCIVLSNARPYISPEASELMLRTGMENTAALLEELELTGKAIYLPSTMREGHQQALIPLDAGLDMPRIQAKIPGRLIVRYGDNPEDMAIAVTTPGSLGLTGMDIALGPTAAEIESAITYMLTGLLDLATSATVNITDNRLAAVIDGARLHYEDIWYYRCLGSPIASIVASISSEALGKPVRILEESYDRGKSKIIIEVLT